MNTYINSIAAATVLLSFSAGPAFAGEETNKRPLPPASTTPAVRDQPAAALEQATEALEKQIAAWPERPRLQARVMIGKYGAPQEVTADKLCWMKPGIYKRITLSKHEDQHDFPKPHTDFLEHTINYKMPAGKADELSKYDGSCTFDRTRGELSARCDLESHNILTLNLAHDVITGKKTAEEARKAFGEIVGEEMLGNHPKYVEALQFEPAQDDVKFLDKPTIPGSPKRADAMPDGDKPGKGSGDKQAKEGGDAEILSFVIAVSGNEIGTAMVACTKKVSPEVLAFAKMMHTEHGKNAAQTLKLGQKIDVTPLDTAAVDKLRVKAAGELADLVPLEGDEFGTAYVASLVKCHTEVLEMIDNELLPKAEHDAVKKHLTDTRAHVAAHLEAAKELQGGTPTSSTPSPTEGTAAPGAGEIRKSTNQPIAPGAQP